LKTLESLATTCGTSSLFVQVTVVPAAIAKSGPKLKLSILTSAPDVVLLSALTDNLGVLMAAMTTADRIVALSTANHFVRFMFLFSFM
jgi:hypothetical protein